MKQPSGAQRPLFSAYIYGIIFIVLAFIIEGTFISTASWMTILEELLTVNFLCAAALVAIGRMNLMNVAWWNRYIAPFTFAIALLPAIPFLFQISFSTLAIEVGAIGLGFCIYLAPANSADVHDQASKYMRNRT